MQLYNLSNIGNREIQKVVEFVRVSRVPSRYVIRTEILKYGDEVMEQLLLVYK